MSTEGLRPARGVHDPEYDPSAWIAMAKQRIADERKAAEEAQRARLRPTRHDALEDPDHAA